MALFTSGQVLTAAQLNALAGFVRKTADQSITSSTVMTNDTHLSYAVGIGTYVVDMALFITSAADNAGDFKYGFTFPTATMHFGQVAPAISSLGTGATAAADWVYVLSATSGTSTAAIGASAFGIYAQVHGILIATAAGTLQFQWAQFASSASATTLKAGSHMCVRQVA